MNYLEWYPPYDGDMISFETQYDAPYKLVSLDGIGPVGVRPISIKSPSQAGETALDVLVPPRVVVVQGFVQASSQAALWPLRRALSRACAAQPVRYGETLELGRLRLYRDTYLGGAYITLPGSTPDILELDCRVQSIAMPAGKNNVGITTFDVEFYAPSPYWREVDDTYASMSGSGGFVFPLVFTEEFPGGSVRAEIDNGGDVDAPVILRLFGDSTNPRLTNETSGETIEVVGSFTADEYVEINTGFGQKTVEKVTISTGARANVFGQLDPDSDLWSLRPGVNSVLFDADAIGAGYADLRWRERYAGV